MLGNYVGVTGFTEQEQISSVLDQIKIESLDNKLLMCGVVVSKARLDNRTPAYPNRYPVADKIATIFSNDPRCLNLIHYRPTAASGSMLLKELDTVMEIAGEYCHGIQINPPTISPWPSLYDVYNFRRKYNIPRIVLQINKQAVKSDKLYEVADRCLDYTDIVTDWLIDQSGGAGSDSELNVSMQLIQKIHELDPAVSLGIAGGLDSENVAGTANTIKSILGHTNFNLDAEGKLRNPADDTLDINKAAQYINAAL